MAGDAYRVLINFLLGRGDYVTWCPARRTCHKHASLYFTRARKRAHTHSQSKIYMPGHTQIRTQKYTYTVSHAKSITHIHGHPETHDHAHTDIYKHAHTPHIHTRNTHVYPRIHRHVHTRSHTRTHTDTHTQQTKQPTASSDWLRYAGAASSTRSREIN